MMYNSTRNSQVEVPSAQAIAQGISSEGGLFVPRELPVPLPERFGGPGKKALRGARCVCPFEIPDGFH